MVRACGSSSWARSHLRTYLLLIHQAPHLPPSHPPGEGECARMKMAGTGLWRSRAPVEMPSGRETRGGSCDGWMEGGLLPSVCWLLVLWIWSPNPVIWEVCDRGVGA